MGGMAEASLSVSAFMFISTYGLASFSPAAENALSDAATAPVFSISSVESCSKPYSPALSLPIRPHMSPAYGISSSVRQAASNMSVI